MDLINKEDSSTPPILPEATVILHRVDAQTSLPDTNQDDNGKTNETSVSSLPSAHQQPKGRTNDQSPGSTIIGSQTPPRSPSHLQQQPFLLACDSPTSSKHITTNIISDLKEAFRLKTTKKSGDVTKANQLFNDAIDLLTSLPQITNLEKQSEIHALHASLAQKNRQIADLNHKLTITTDQLSSLQENFIDIQELSLTENQTDSTLPRQTISSFMGQVNNNITNGRSKMEAKILSYIDEKLSKLPSSSSTTNEQLPNTTAKGAIVLTPPNPIPPKEQPSYLAALKNSLSRAKVDNSTIAATHDTKHGSLIIKCKNEQDLRKLQHSLSKDRDIKKLATISRKGPKRIKLIIKKLPYDMEDSLLKTSLDKSINGQYSMGRYFVYRNKQAFSQVVELDEERARQILSTPSPSIQIGPCFYPVDIFIPIVRCYKCQAFGHAHTSCLQKNSYCAICGHSGHTSESCRSHNDLGCINCSSHNNRNSDQQQHHDTAHEAFSTNCPSFIEFFSKSYNNQYSSLFPQHPQQF